MPRMSVPTEAQDYKPQELLSNGKYSLRTTRGNPAGNSIALSVEVLDGPTQADNSNPQGREFDFFVTAKFDNITKESFKRQLIDKYGAMLACHEVTVDADGTFDTDDLAGREYEAVVSRRRDQNGIMKNEVREFLVAE